MAKSKTTVGLALVLVGLIAAGPVYAGGSDAPVCTLIDLSPDDTASQEVAAEFLRSLRQSQQVRFRDLDDALNIGGEELVISSLKSADGLVRSGKAKLDKKEFDDAADDLREAVDNYLTGLAHVADPAVVAKAMGLLAAAQWLAGDTKAAATSMARCVQFDPKLEQDFKDYPAGDRKSTRLNSSH